jgi:hypothetical protein
MIHLHTNLQLPGSSDSQNITAKQSANESVLKADSMFLLLFDLFGLLCRRRVIVKMIVEKHMECRLWHGKPKFSEKTCPSATFIHHKIPHDQTWV